MLCSIFSLAYFGWIDGRVPKSIKIKKELCGWPYAFTKCECGFGEPVLLTGVLAAALAVVKYSQTLFYYSLSLEAQPGICGNKKEPHGDPYTTKGLQPMRMQ